jgi:hypothetical protein
MHLLSTALLLAISAAPTQPHAAKPQSQDALTRQTLGDEDYRAYKALLECGYLVQIPRDEPFAAEVLTSCETAIDLWKIELLHEHDAKARRDFQNALIDMDAKLQSFYWLQLLHIPR